MLLLLRALVIAIALASPGSVSAQQPPPKTPPSDVQGAKVPSGNQTKAGGNDHQPADSLTVLQSAQPPQDQNAGRSRTHGDDGVGASESRHEQNETDLTNFTKLLAGATILLMIATGGLWWETRTLARQAKEASKDTKRSIEIAERAVRETARAAQAAVDAASAERAWLMLTGFQTPRFQSASIEGVPCGPGVAFILNIANAGRSPALKMSSFVRLKLIGYGEEIPEFDFNAVKGEGNQSLPIGNNQTINTLPRVIADNDYADWIERRRRVIIFCRAVYNTTNSNKIQYLNICVEMQFHGEMIDQNTGHSGPNIMMVPIGDQCDIGEI